jgi:DNA-binding NarL/FixJ family response regulator
LQLTELSLPDELNGGRRVFIAEDEALLRLMLCDMLAELGHEVVAEAYNLERAIKLAAEADYELAILDLNLGNGISYDVAEVVRGRGKALVLSTGYGRTGLNSKYEGCVVLQKPFTRDAVCRALQLTSERPTDSSATSSGIERGTREHH